MQQKIFSYRFWNVQLTSRSIYYSYSFCFQRGNWNGVIRPQSFVCLSSIKFPIYLFILLVWNRFICLYAEAKLCYDAINRLLLLRPRTKQKTKKKNAVSNLICINDEFSCVLYSIQRCHGDHITTIQRSMNILNNITHMGLNIIEKIEALIQENCLHHILGIQARQKSVM